MGETWAVTWWGKDTGLDHWLKGRVSRSIRKAQRERCSLQVGVIVTPGVWLKWIEMTTYITKYASSFLVAHF